MVRDRRAHVRRQRLLKVRFDWNGGTHVGVTTDLSLGGAFLNTTVYPPVGTELELVHVPDGSANEVTFRAQVRRVADPKSRNSVLPGVGVQWLEVVSDGTAGQLQWILKNIMETDLPVLRADDGTSRWVPGDWETGEDEGNNSGFFRDLRALEDVLPEPGPERDEDPVSGRRARRYVLGEATEVTVYVKGVPTVGYVRDVSLRGMYIESAGALPVVGEVAQVRYPLPDPVEIQYARLVCAVVRADDDDELRGFAVAIIRIHNMGSPGAFETHVAAVEAKRATERARNPEAHRPQRPRTTFNRGTALRRRRSR